MRLVLEPNSPKLDQLRNVKSIIEAQLRVLADLTHGGTGLLMLLPRPFAEQDFLNIFFEKKLCRLPPVFNVPQLH